MVMNNEQDESGPGPRPKAWWSRQGTMGKAAWVAGLLAVSGVMLGAALWLLHADRDVLFAHLSASDAAVFVAELDRLKQPYELSDGGTTILVDRSVVHATRLKLLGKDLPLHGAVGFELFNTSDAGMTEFAQKVNYQRALQGEITRTILSMEEVAAARVHLVLPEEGLFRREQARAKASVTLTLRNGRTLQAPQVAGIQRLIASAVPGVAVQDVTIVDNRGVALTRGGGSTAIVEGHAHLDLKREIEQHLARKANDVLERLFGAGSALTQVDATLNLNQLRVTTEDVLTPSGRKGGAGSGVVVRERESVREDGPPTSGRRDAAVPAGAGSSFRETEYQVGRRVEQMVSQPGSIERLQVVAVVQAALTPAQLEPLRALVGAAVGHVAQRGDVVVVQALSQLAAGGALANARVQAESNTQDPAQPGPPRRAEAAPQTPASPSAIQALAVLAILLAALATAALLYRLRQPRGAREPAPLNERQRQEVLHQVRRWLGEVPHGQ